MRSALILFNSSFSGKRLLAWSTRPGPLRCCNDTVRHIHRSIYDDRRDGNCRQRGLRIIIIAHIILYPQQSIGKQPSSLGSNRGNLSPHRRGGCRPRQQHLPPLETPGSSGYRTLPIGKQQRNCFNRTTESINFQRFSLVFRNLRLSSFFGEGARMNE